MVEVVTAIVESELAAYQKKGGEKGDEEGSDGSLRMDEADKVVVSPLHVAALKGDVNAMREAIAQALKEHEEKIAAAQSEDRHSSSIVQIVDTSDNPIDPRTKDGLLTRC